MSIPKKPLTPFTPFADESTTLQIGDLNIENRTDRVSLFGSVDITRDKIGLALAQELKVRIDHLVEVLESDHLPEMLDVVSPTQVQNPFASP